MIKLQITFFATLLISSAVIKMEPDRKVKYMDGYVIDKYYLGMNSLDTVYSFKYSRFTGLDSKNSYDLLNGYSIIRLQRDCKCVFDSSRFYIDSLPPKIGKPSSFGKYIFRGAKDSNELYVVYRISGEAMIINEGCDELIRKKLNRNEQCPESIKYPLILFYNPIRKTELSKSEMSKLNLKPANINTFAMIFCE